MNNVLNSNRGFSLIEILVAMIIASVLMTVGIVSTQHTRERALMALLYEDSRRIREGADRFARDCGFLPYDVARGVDPSLFSKQGFAGGEHSPMWDDADLSCWNGPYVREWKRNPWGGLYDWDNFPKHFPAWGIPGGGCYITLKPAEWGGKDGMPSEEIEIALQEHGADKAVALGVIAMWMGATDDPPPAE